METCKARPQKNFKTTITVRATHQVIAYAIALLHTCYQPEDALRTIAAYFKYDIQKKA